MIHSPLYMMIHSEIIYYPSAQYLLANASTTMQFHGHFVPAYRIRGIRGREIRGVVDNLLKHPKYDVASIGYESQ
jgi:hypothetical protein